MRIPLRMLDPRVGIRRKVSIIRKDLLTRHVGGKLHKQARLAQANVQWIEHLGLVELLLRHIALAKRRHPEIDERMNKRSTAQTALRHSRHRLKNSPNSSVPSVRCSSYSYVRRSRDVSALRELCAAGAARRGRGVLSTARSPVRGVPACAASRLRVW